MNIRCSACYGSGKMMGGGMIMKDCDRCNGKGKISDEVEAHTDIKVDKRSKHYKDAIKKIKNLDDNMTDEKAEQIFDDEMNKIENKK